MVIEQYIDIPKERINRSEFTINEFGKLFEVQYSISQFCESRDPYSPNNTYQRQFSQNPFSVNIGNHQILHQYPGHKIIEIQEPTIRLINMSPFNNAQMDRYAASTFYITKILTDRLLEYIRLDKLKLLDCGSGINGLQTIYPLKMGVGYGHLVDLEEWESNIQGNIRLNSIHCNMIKYSNIRVEEMLNKDNDSNFIIANMGRHIGYESLSKKQNGFSHTIDHIIDFTSKNAAVFVGGGYNTFDKLLDASKDIETLNRNGFTLEVKAHDQENGHLAFAAINYNRLNSL